MSNNRDTSRGAPCWKSHLHPELAAWLAGAAAILGVTLWYFFDALTGTINFVLPPDTSEFLYPLEYRIAAAMKSGTLPLWNPYSFGGYPLVGYPQYGLLYPVNWIFWLWPYGGPAYSVVGYAWKFVFHVALGGFGMFYLCRAVGLRFAAALLGGVAYMLLPNTLAFAVWGNAQPAFAWWPFVIAWLIRAEEKPESRIGYSVLAALGVGVDILAAPSQPAIQLIFLVACLFLYFTAHDIWRNGNRGPKLKLIGQRLVRYAAIGVASIGIAAVTLLPVVEFQSHALRFLGAQGVVSGLQRMSYAAFTAERFDLGQLAGFLDPARSGSGAGNNYLGPVLLLLIPAIAGRAWRRSPLFLFFAGVSVFAALYSFGLVFPRLFYLIPGLNMIREPARYMSVLGFGGAVVAAYGMDILTPGRGPLSTGDAAGRAWLWGGLLLGVALIVATGLLPVIPPFLLSTAGAIALGLLAGRCFPVAGHLVGCVLIVLCCLSFRTIEFPYQQTAQFSVDNELESSKALSPWIQQGEAPDRVMFFLSGVLRDGPGPNPGLTDFLGLHGIFGFGNPVLRPALHTYGSAYDSPNAWLYLNLRYFVADAAGEAALMEKFPGLLRRAGGPTEILIPDLAESTWVRREAFVVLETQVKPSGGWVVADYDVVSSPDPRTLTDEWTFGEAVQLANPLGKALLAQAPDNLVARPNAPAVAATVTWLRSSYNSLSLEVTSAEPGLLVLPEWDFPGWRATVNGVSTPILQANGYLRALVVPRGTSSVEMRYRPNSFLAGAAISIMSQAGLLAWYIVGRRGGLARRASRRTRAPGQRYT